MAECPKPMKFSHGVGSIHQGWVVNRLTPSPTVDTFSQKVLVVPLVIETPTRLSLKKALDHNTHSTTRRRIILRPLLYSFSFPMLS
jgi:hypothetical protein